MYDVMWKRFGFVDWGFLVMKDIMESDGFVIVDEKMIYMYDKKLLYVCLWDENSNFYVFLYFWDLFVRLN